MAGGQHGANAAWLCIAAEGLAAPCAGVRLCALAPAPPRSSAAPPSPCGAPHRRPPPAALIHFGSKYHDAPFVKFDCDRCAQGLGQGVGARPRPARAATYMRPPAAPLLVHARRPAPTHPPAPNRCCQAGRRRVRPVWGRPEEGPALLHAAHGGWVGGWVNGPCWLAVGCSAPRGAGCCQTASTRRFRGSPSPLYCALTLRATTLLPPRAPCCRRASTHIHETTFSNPSPSPTLPNSCLAAGHPAAEQHPQGAQGGAAAAAERGGHLLHGLHGGPGPLRRLPHPRHLRPGLPRVVR